MDLLTMAFFTFVSSFLMMENWETSAALPAVVGMQITGGQGSGIRSTPTNSLTWEPFAWTRPDGLRAVHGASAPQGKNQVAPLVREDARPRHDHRGRGIRPNIGEDGVVQLLLFESLKDGFPASPLR